MVRIRGSVNPSGEQFSLPNYRAFLVRYAAESNLEEDEVCGRVEHVDSGQSKRFRSREELERFIVDVLREEEAKRERA